MILKFESWMVAAKGSLGKTHYAVPIPYRPGWVIVRTKPGSHNPPGTRKDRLWHMKESQAAGVERMMNWQRRASEEYRDPVKRAAWEAEYEAWKQREQKNNRSGYMLDGKVVRHTWDYVRIRVRSLS